MEDAKKRAWPGAEQREFIHSARTAVAAMAALAIGHLLRMPEAYWTVITALIVMQSTFGAAWTISKERLAGTAMGAAVGGLLAMYVGSNIFVFGAAVFVMGVICAILHITRNAYRYAGITLAIVMLVAHTQPAWITAIHRFIAISVGIVVGLIVTALWPEAGPTTA
jgi:uncharacterized membrane protein YccC